jgi:hypothetical protein
MEDISMTAFRGPVLIAEPELRWPVLVLAAVITALLALLTAGLYYVAMTRSDVSSYAEPRLEGALQPGHRDQTVAIVPWRQNVLEPGEAINTRILLDGIDEDSDRARLVLKVTAKRFEES